MPAAVEIRDSSFTSSEGIETHDVSFWLQNALLSIISYVKVPRPVPQPGYEHDVYLRQPGPLGFGSDYVLMNPQH